MPLEVRNPAPVSEVVGTCPSMSAGGRRRRRRSGPEGPAGVGRPAGRRSGTRREPALPGPAAYTEPRTVSTRHL